MKYSEIKKLKAFCDALFSEPDYREVLSEIDSKTDDFEVGDVRFIKMSCIDRIQRDELRDDLYLLGCFNADFLSGILDIDCDVIVAMQEAEAYEAVGKLIISLDGLKELQESYASADGYGHHFNSHDFGEEELTINGIDYYVFDQH